MLGTLITSNTRVKLLMKFFLNSRTTSYLRDLEAEFGESSNAIRVELIRLEEAGLLNSEKSGNKKLYRANRCHPLYFNIRELLMKHTGVDHLIEKVVNKLGGLHSAYMLGSLARGQDSRIIDLLLVGCNIDRQYLLNLVEKAESIIKRKVSFVIITPEEADTYLKEYPEALLLWEEK